MSDVSNDVFFKSLQSDREVDVIFWKKHPELRKQLVDDAYADRAHFIFELLQNSEDAIASTVSFEVHNNDLEFIHDGKKMFTEQDITAITDFSKSAKTDTHGTIGKFGIGFKSVFKYTETPHIYSGEFSLKIRDLVYPEPLPMLTGIGEETRFLFPFNHPKKPAQQAVNEIENGLKDLGDNTLLFLAHIRKIAYYLPDGTFGSLERIDHDDGHIEIRTCHPGANESTSHWMRFENDVEVTGEDGERKNCRVAIAYSIEEENEKKRKGAGWKIVPLGRGQVSIYFPAIEESSNLRFHIHAPFASTVARANVTKEEPANQTLRDHLSELVVESLKTIRDSGMLTVEFLSVLPNPNDNLPPFYQPIQDAIINAFREQPLTPTRSGSHAKVESLFTGPAKIANVLGDEGLGILTGNTPPLWAENPPPQHPRANYFLENLKIEEWEWYELAESLYQSKFSSWDVDSVARQTRIERWISSLGDDKLMRLYALLGEAYSQRGPNYKPYRELKFIRVAADSVDVHVRAQDVYLQPVDGINPPSGIRYVKPEVYSKGRSDEQKRYALMFLDHIGVPPFDQKQVTLRRIEFYVAPPVVVPKSYVEDVAHFVDLFLNHPSECGKLKEIPFLRGTSPDGTVHWRKPFELYLDQPYLDTGLDALFNDKDIVLEKRKERILDDYRDIPKFFDFAAVVGVMAGLEIVPHEATDMQKDEFLKLGRFSKKSTEDFDYFINYLSSNRMKAWQYKSSQYCLGRLSLEPPNMSLSLAVWRTMCGASPECLEAHYVPNASKRHEAKRGSSYIVRQLSSANWVPDKNEVFKKPSNITKEELHPDFYWDDRNGWLTAIGFEKIIRERSEAYQIKNTAAQDIGFKSVDRAAKWAEVDKAGIDPDEILANSKKPELPESAVNNPDRRRKRMLDDSANAPDSESVRRERSVQPWINEDTGRAKAYLRSLYINDDNEMVCQCCHQIMPFKVRELHYFEAVQCIKEKKRCIENRLALCPTCAAMYQYAEKIEDSKLIYNIVNLNKPETSPSVEIPLKLAGAEYRLHFVGKHWFDLKTLLGAE